MFLSVAAASLSLPEKGKSWVDSSDAEFYRFTAGKTHVALRKRQAYPGTFARQRNNILEFGYGTPPAASSGAAESAEYLLCRIDATAGAIVIMRDAFCTLPLFYSVRNGTLFLGDDLGRVIEGQPLSVNERALAHLLLRPAITEETLFAGVNLLTAGSVLEWSGTAPRLQYHTARLALAAGAAVQFKDRLESVFDGYLERTQGTRVAFEVSGGIDSATLPLYAAQQEYMQGPLATMRFPDTFGETQDEKLGALTEHTHAPIVSHQVTAEDYPLARFFKNGFKPAPFYQYQEIYSEALNGLASALKLQGVQVIFTGIGGDELFENPGQPARVPAPQNPGYFTPDGFHRLVTSLRTGHRRGETGQGVADSAFFAGQSRNKIYIDNGIWPIAPLADPALHAFTQQLPITYRANKNILRAYYEASSLPAVIYRPVQNEHFGRFFDDSVKRQYANVLQILGEHSQLASGGMVAWPAVIEAFDEARWHENRSAELFAIFRLASAEVILQSIRVEANRAEA